MKNVKKTEWIAYLGYFLVGLIVGLILVGLGKWMEGLFVLLPLPFTLILFLSFLMTLRGKKGIGLVLYTSIRIALILAMVAIPAVVWYFVPVVHNSVSAFLLLASPFEALAVYILALVSILLDKRFRE